MEPAKTVFNSLGMSPEEIITHLSKLCIKKEKKDYTRTMTSEELIAEEKDYIRNHMELSRLEDEMEAAKGKFDECKIKVKNFEESLVKALQRIKNQKRDCCGQLYSIPNHTTGMIEIYDELGEMIDTRPIQPAERQARLLADNGDGDPIANPDDVEEDDDEEDGEDEPETLDEAIEQMEEKENIPTIAGSAPAPETNSEVEPGAKLDIDAEPSTMKDFEDTINDLSIPYPDRLAYYNKHKHLIKTPLEVPVGPTQAGTGLGQESPRTIRGRGRKNK